MKIEPISANEGCTRLWKSEIHFDGIFEGLGVQPLLGAAPGRAARRLSGLVRSDKSADELAFHFCGQCIDIEALSRQESSRVIDAVNSCGLDLDMIKTGFCELLCVFIIAQGSGKPTQSSRLFLISAGTWPRTTTSDTAKRPPGLSTRKASLSTRSLSPERLMTQFEMMTSTDSSGSGIFHSKQERCDKEARPVGPFRAKTGADAKAVHPSR